MSAHPPTVYILTPLTDEANSWIDENIIDPTFFGDGVVIEHRFLVDILHGIQADQLVHHFTLRS